LHQDVKVEMNYRCNVAIVDDDNSVRKALRRLMWSVDFKATTFASGREFLAVVAGLEPDCVVLDLQMPDLNGLEVQQELTERGIRLPIIFITAHDEPGARTECLAAGALNYLRKPLDEKLLLDAIDQALRSSQG
jgi:FixJ family two-component response regulator